MKKIERKTPEDIVLNASKIECKSCTHCCEYGSGIVLEKELDELSKNLNISKDKLKEKYLIEFTNLNTTHYKFRTIRKKGQKGLPYGKCIMLDKTGCSIHSIKPLHCRVGTCNELGEEINLWFITNHFLNEYDPESIRQWNLLIKLGNRTIPGTAIEELVPDKDKRKEIFEYKILR